MDLADALYTLNLIDFGGAEPDVGTPITLFAMNGATWVGDATDANFVAGTDLGRYFFDTTFGGDGILFGEGVLQIQLDEIPEPSVAALLLAALFGLTSVRRRRD